MLKSERSRDFTGHEREYLDKMKQKASYINRVIDNPDYFVLLTDAASVWRGDTPKVGDLKSQDSPFSKETNKWETRIIGVEAYCGPISTIFFYTVDNMQCGGANLMVCTVRCFILFDINM